MPRPKRCRKVCSMPRVSEFAPVGEDADFVILTVDEYESIRLIDKQGFSQGECAVYMQIAGTTAQQIYNSARKKIASALVDGMDFALLAVITVCVTETKPLVVAEVVPDTI